MWTNAIPPQLALKEIRRNKGRFLLVGAVIALITLLVLFLAALGEGLANGNREYLSKLDAELILFQETADLSIPASQLGRSIMNDVRRVDGIRKAGAIGYSSVFMMVADIEEQISVTMLGVEPGRPGVPPALKGRSLSGTRANEAIIDRNAARRSGLGIGDVFTIQTTQGSIEESFELQVVGISDGRQYFLQPTIVVPLLTWDRIRPRAAPATIAAELVFNIIAVQLEDPESLVSMAGLLEAEVSGIEAVDRRTAYEAAPGYQAQQSTLQTQQGFTLLIGILVVGGFFQIQTLQKVAQIGMLKALGASNLTIGLTAMFQIAITNLAGVLAGALATIVLTVSLPVAVPTVFTGSQVATALISLLLIGPIGGLVSLRALLRIEPLTALGLSA